MQIHNAYVLTQEFVYLMFCNYRMLSVINTGWQPVSESCYIFIESNFDNYGSGWTYFILKCRQVEYFVTSGLRKSRVGIQIQVSQSSHFSTPCCIRPFWYPKSHYQGIIFGAHEEKLLDIPHEYRQYIVLERA